MKSSLFVLASLLIALPAANAQGPMRVAPSGRGITEVVLTFVDSAAREASKPSIIRIDYGQPHLRGRQIHTDSLVPYDKVWRTGANNATTLTTDVDLVIGGKDVPKGKWVVQTIPGRTVWKLLIQKEQPPPPPGTEAVYNPANDIAQIDMRRTTRPVPLESLTMWLIPSRAPGPPHGDLIIAWGNVSVSTDWRMK